MPPNNAQSLSLATTLRLLEERCDQMQRLLVGAEHAGVLLRTVRDIPADTRSALVDQLAAVRAEIAHLAARFQLAIAPRSARQALAALLATGWQDLEDERPDKLRRYGPVDPAVIPALDASVSQLIWHIQTMQALLAGDRQPEPPQ